MLESYPHDIRYIQVESDNDYWRLLRELWHEQNPFVIIEHDIIPWPGAISGLMVCGKSWCSHTYRTGAGYSQAHGFGCVMFKPQIMEMMPDIWDKFDCHNWRGLDTQFAFEALKFGFIPHLHGPPVIHVPK